MVVTEVANQKQPSMLRGKAVAVAVGAAILAAVALGVLSGWFTGKSGLAATVLAATIPGILSLGGGGLALVSMRSGDVLAAVHAAVFIVVFCVCFVTSAEFGANQRSKELRENTEKAWVKYTKALQACTQEEYKTNEARKQLELDPLPSEYFCKTPPPLAVRTADRK